MDGRSVASIVHVVVAFVVVGVGLRKPFVVLALALIPDADGVCGLLLGECDDAGPTGERCSGLVAASPDANHCGA